MGQTVTTYLSHIETSDNIYYGNMSDGWKLGDIATPGGYYRVNEPSSMTQIIDRNFSALDQGWTDYDFDIDGQSTITTDGDAPQSPSNVLSCNYDKDAEGGYHYGNQGIQSFSNYDTLYVYFAFKMSSNWQGHGSGVNKNFFIAHAGTGGADVDGTVLACYGIDDGTLSIQIRCQSHTTGGSYDGTGARNITRNQGSAGDDEVTRGQWHEVEFTLGANTPGSQDGTCDVWLDGTKIIAVTDFGPTRTGNNSGFQRFTGRPIWGGTGDTIEEDMNQFWDHLRVSGKN